jgi:acetylornithine deacetylase/succinyl-diaminopimelate desuccinylase-like protein
MLTGATDSAQLRERGVQTYGIGPGATEEDSGRVHGNDERVSVAGLKMFLEYVYRAVVELAGVPEANR